MRKQTERKILTGEEIDALETLLNDCGITCTMEPSINVSSHLITAKTVEQARQIKEISRDLGYSAIGPSYGKNKFCVIVY